MLGLILATLAVRPIPLSPAQRLAEQAIHDDGARAVDKFSQSTVDRSLIGQQVHQVVHPHDGDRTGIAASTSAYWTYKDGKLNFVLSPHEVGSRYENDLQRVIVYQTFVTRSSIYIGSNAFGVRTKVTERFWHSRGLAIVAEGDTEIAIGGTSSDRNFEFAIDASGDEARRLVGDVIFVIDGKIADLSPNLLTACKNTLVSPTIDNPYDDFVQFCWTGVRNFRVSLIRLSTGEVLKSW